MQKQDVDCMNTMMTLTASFLFVDEHRSSSSVSSSQVESMAGCWVYVKVIVKGSALYLIMMN